MPFFVYLEFTDPKVREFLYSLRESINGVQDTKPIHITVRGPYDKQPDVESLSELNEEIRGYGVLIGGVGIFDIPSGFVVYLKVQSPQFNKIWWKPDYKIEEYGINPHITIYETSNKEAAQIVEKFIRAERIEIFTFSSILTVNMSKQNNLFETNINSILQGKRTRSIERWSVRPGIIQRAKEVREKLTKFN